MWREIPATLFGISTFRVHSMKPNTPLILPLLVSLHFTAAAYTINDLQIGDTVRVLTPHKSYRLRIYTFLDQSSCIVCMHNMSTLYEKLRTEQIEYVAILNGYSQLEADSFRVQAEWDFSVIGDQFQIYRSFYRIRRLPTLIALDNTGKVLLISSPTAPQIGTTLLKLLENQSLPDDDVVSPALERVQTLPVRTASGAPLKSTFMRRLLPWSDCSRYALINALGCSLMIIDTNGTIIQTVPFRLDTQRCMYGWDLAWLEQDSVIVIFGSTFQQRHFLAIYRFPDETISKIVYLPRRQYGTNLVLFDKRLIIEYDHPSRTTQYLGKDDTVGLIIDLYGVLHGVLKGYDSVYNRYKLSHWCATAIGHTSNGIVTLAQFENRLCLWNSEGLLIREYPLLFGKSYRQITTDIPTSSSGYVTLLNGKPVAHWISSLAYRHILFDSVTKMILISYRNEEYPDGIIDYTDPSVQHREYLHVCLIDGTRLFSDDLYAGNHFIPHHFINGEIIGTQLDEYSNLKIVRYRLHTPFSQKQ